MNNEIKFIEWIFIPLLTLLGTFYRYFKGLKNFGQFTWFALFVHTLGALAMGLVIYFIGKFTGMSQWILNSLAVLTGIYGEKLFRHFISTYTKIPLPK